MMLTVDQVVEIIENELHIQYNKGIDRLVEVPAWGPDHIRIDGIVDLHSLAERFVAAAKGTTET